MFSQKKTIILRHRKENLRKCSLQGLEDREDLIFLRYPLLEPLHLRNYFLLTMDGPVISEKDKDLGLFLVDATWKYAAIMIRSLPIELQTNARSLPKGIKTAYPRKQTHCSNPDCGLASIEALYAAYIITKKDPKGLLDLYHWKEEFLEKNRLFFR